MFDTIFLYTERFLRGFFYEATRRKGDFTTNFSL